MTNEQLPTLFYDGMCPLCRREIAMLRRLSQGRLSLRDIHATVAAWATTRWGWLWRPLKWAGLRPLAERLYAWWAGLRYQRLYGIQRCSDEK